MEKWKIKRPASCQSSDQLELNDYINIYIDQAIKEIYIGYMFRLFSGSTIITLKNRFITEL
jgi:hypothetical protein